MNTGKLNKRIIIVFKGVATPTELGGTSFATGTEKTVWGSANQLSMSEQLRNGIEAASASYQFGFRFQSVDEVSRVESIRYKSRTFRIVSVQNVDEKDNYVLMIGNEQR